MRLNLLWLATALVALLSGCDVKPPVPEALKEETCGGQRCGDDERCDAPTLHCVFNQEPQLTVAGPAEAVTQLEFQITGTMTDDGAQGAVQWQEGEGDWHEVAVIDGKFAFLVASGDVDSVHRLFTVRATDGHSTVSRVVDVVVDRVGPTLELVSPKSTSIVAGAEAKVVVIARDGSGELQSMTIAGIFVPTPRVDSEVSASVAVPPADLRDFEVAVAAVDRFGNRTAKTFSFQTDSSGPLVTFVEPTVATPPIMAPRFQARVKAIDASAVTKVRIALGDGPFVEASAQGEVWSADFDIPRVEGQSVQFTAEATDGVGNVRTAVSAAVPVDRLGPSVAFVQPAAAEGFYRAGFHVEVSSSADTKSGTATFAGQTVDLVAGPAGSWHCDVPVPAAHDLGLETLSVLMRDATGSETRVEQKQYVDTVAPTLTFVSPTNDAKFNAADLASVPGVKVQWAVADGDPLAATASVDGAPFVASEVLVATQPTDNGVTYTKTVVARDRAGNQTTGSIRFQVDRVAPTGTFIQPAASGGFYKAGFRVEVSSTDAVGGSVSFLGKTQSLAVSAGRLSGDLSPVAGHDFASEVVAVKLRDAFGNEGQVQQSQYIDNVAPRLDFTAPAADARFNIASVGTGAVTVSWSVSDADPQRKVSVDGVETTSDHVAVATQATDNGVSYMRTVVVTDRAGNQTTGSRSFSVDRVAPTVVSWTPAANARNLETRTTAVEFSEPVWAGASSADAISLSPSPAGSGTWNTNHSGWTSAVLRSYTVYEGALAGLVDAYGNPVAASARRFHTSALIPAYEATLATGVESFKATSNADGVVSLAMKMKSGAFRVHTISPETGELGPVLYDQPSGVVDYQINSWVDVDSGTLRPTQRLGLTYRYELKGLGGTVIVNTGNAVAIDNGVVTNLGVFSDPYFGAVISRPSVGEPDSSPYAVIDGTTFRRGSWTRTLPWAPTLISAQSTQDWAVFTVEDSALRWLRVTSDVEDSFYPVSFSVSASSPKNVQAALIPPEFGQRGCLAASWVDSTFASKVVFQSLTDCHLKPIGMPYAGCSSGAAQVVNDAPRGFSVAPFYGSSHHTIVTAHEEDGTGPFPEPQIKLSMSDCSTTLTTLLTVEGLSLTIKPIQIGRRPALLLLDYAGNLSIYPAP